MYVTSERRLDVKKPPVRRKRSSIEQLSWKIFFPPPLLFLYLQFCSVVQLFDLWYFLCDFFAFSNRLFVQRSVTHTKNKEENNIDECMYAIMTKIILAIKIRLTESVKSAKVRHYVIGW